MSSSTKTNKQIAISIDPSPTIKPKDLALRNPNDLIKRLLPKKKRTSSKKKPYLYKNDSRNLKTIQIKNEDDQPESNNTKVLTSEASTLINDKLLKKNINKTQGYIFKNHRSMHKPNQKERKKENEANLFNDKFLFKYKPSMTEYNYKGNGLTTSISKAKLSNSIYFILGKRNIDRVDQIKMGLSDNSVYNGLVKQRKLCTRQNPITYFLSQDKKERIVPFSEPLPLLHEQQFENESEMNRFQKMNNSLLNLKYKISSNPKQEMKLLKEFIFNTGIYHNDYFTSKSLDKLASFIKSNFTINPKKSLKMNIIDIINSARLENDNEKKGVGTTIPFRTLPKSKGGKSTNNIKEIKIDYCNDIRLNMNLQKSLYENKTLSTNIDLFNNPEPTIKELKKELNHCYSHIPFKKTVNDTFLVHYTNMRNTPHKLKQSHSREDNTIDINEIKKQNKLLEYICYEKALNYSQVKECNSKVPFLKTINI